MSAASTSAEAANFSQLSTIVEGRLAKNRRVRRNLPGGGRLRMDRQLPFLCVYRQPPRSDAGTRELVTSEAAYLHASGQPQHQRGIGQLCGQIASTMREHFGTFLIVEVWSQQQAAEASGGDVPDFQVHCREASSMPGTLETFCDALGQIDVDGAAATVEVCQTDRIAPPELPPLALACQDTALAGVVHLGIAVRPFYRDNQTGELYPVVLEELRGQWAWALRRAISKFTGGDGKTTAMHYHTLGPTALVKAARLVDQQLCEVSQSFDFLLQVTPINSDEAWAEFQASGFAGMPLLRYRPLPYRINLLKRRLFDIEIERIEDTTLAKLFWEKQDELDCELTALRHLDTSQFLHSSLQLYGGAEDDLVQLAAQLLDRSSQRPAAGTGTSDRETPRGRSANAASLSLDAVVKRAREEIDYYHRQMPSFNATVEVCNEIASGIMVSQGKLLVAETLKLSPRRIGPLLHHEIGTHLLTYFNGRNQPFRQLYAGLARYEELQEGLAVLAEYLTGGLTAGRLRGLAARVIAARSMTDGAAFSDTFARLHEEHGLGARKSFVTTLRAYRGGGLTKDVIYLRGLRDLLAYLARGHDIEPLYVGKIGLPHLPYIQELRRRGIIEAPAVLPRFWQQAGARERLEACRGLSVTELLEHQT